ncbi:MFS transporter [Candidatus Nitrotoga fabula]|uniref:Nitrate/nitrite transporter NarK n=1 Tax=Candidatus Nitrotoga fabula TaxID=2182327 RepID=A0A916BDB8_9PROT|nr:MFS transporter [Candidatus Nitrotoga fabula]CAE6721864.1 Nitrate/nitrite transporter NarK [Candidatus Nitrotoga fabula]
MHDANLPDENLNKGSKIHPDVLKLGLASFLTDLGSEMIFSVFAVYFTMIAGASATLLWAIEGFADLLASSLNYFAGWLSDRSGKRKVFAIAGHGISALAKIILLFTSSIIGLSIFRIIERLGKSFRGPPRDAWLSSVANMGTRGYSFGVHKAMDKTGAILGPLIAYSLFSWLGEKESTYEILFMIALVPAFLGVVILSLVKDKPGVPIPQEKITQTWSFISLEFKRYLIVASIFSFAYFSFSFLLLRAYNIGFSIKDIVLLYVLFNISCVIASPLIGKLGDRLGRAYMILLGYLIYLFICLGFAFATTQWQIIVLFVFFGIFYGIDEAQSKAFVVDLELDRRGTAIGLFNFITGIIRLPASIIAGALWLIHPDNSFLFGAFLAFFALLAFLYLRPDHKKIEVK